MQAALSFPSSFLSVLTPTRTLVLPCRDMPRLLHTSLNCPSIKATAVVNDSSTTDYSSNVSVFPTLGGDACDADMYPKVKLKPDTETEKVKTSSELIERISRLQRFQNRISGRGL